MNLFATHFYSVLSEATFRELPEEITQEANKIADAYMQEVKALKPGMLKQIKKLGLQKTWKKYLKDEKGEVWFVADLTTVKFKDLKTKRNVKFRVCVAFGNDNENYAECDTSNKLILLYDYHCRLLSKEKLVSTMVHEITHGFQQHKKYSQKYEKLKKNKTPVSQETEDAMYYKEPIEFDAFTTEIAHTIRTEHARLQSDIKKATLPETKKIMEGRLKKFLYELKVFIQSPFETYFVYKELPLPMSLDTFQTMLEYIQKSPKLWRSFKSKLINLYNKLNASS
jgi:hypothetical protein